ncbi:MAG: HEPN domain-containing protein [Candidatus Asgardarchaeia archaeon]
MNFESCIEKDLIRRNENAKNWVEKEILIAEQFLNQAKRILEIGAYESSEVIAYNAMFHSVRALLYSMGYTEKSHYCLFVAVVKLLDDEKLVELIKEANMYRERRHGISYGGMETDAEEAKNAIRVAVELIRRIKRRLGRGL